MSEEPVDFPEPEEDGQGGQAEDGPKGQGEDGREMARAGRQMAVSAVIISFFLFVGKVAGYGRDMIIAYYFGQSSVTDAFYALYNTIIFNIHTKFEQLMRPTYLPEFVHVRDRDGEDRGWQVTSGATLLLLSALLIIAAALELLAPLIIRLLWEPLAKNPQTFTLAVVMLRIMAPALVFLSLSLMPELTLHAYKRFTLPAVADAAFKTGLALSLVAALYLVWRPGTSTAIYSAALAVVVGGALRLFVQLPGVTDGLRQFRLRAFWRDKSVRAMLLLMPPLMLGLLFSYLRVVADSVYAVRVGKGVYTCLVFGRKITDAPGQILPLAVSFVVFPFLSQWAGKNERARLGRTLVGMTRAMAFVFLPVSVGLIVLSRPIISLVFEQGRFGAEGVHLAAIALRCYAAGIAFFAVEGSLNKWYFALKDTATPSYAGVLSSILHVAIGGFGTFVLNGSVAAIALALTISKSLKVIALYALLRGRVEEVDLHAQVRWAGRLALAMATTAVVIWYLAHATMGFLQAWQPPFGGQKVRLLALLGVVGAGSSVWYAAACWVFGVEEVRIVASRLGEKLRRSGGKA